MQVIKNLQDKFGNLYNVKNIMISATHTHSAPGGYMMYVLFDLTTYGFIKQSFDALVNGITTVSLENCKNESNTKVYRVGVKIWNDQM